MRPEDKERATVEVACRVLGEKLAAAESGRGASVDAWIHETIYEERRRLEKEKPGAARDREAAFLEALQRRARTASEDEKTAILRELIERFVQEIVGNFDPRVYRLATSVVPAGLALLLNALSPRRLLENFPDLPTLSTNVLIRGETEALRRLHERGTVLLCPTHISNLDSIVVGWALHQLGLPPFVYGAGLNLFQNPLVSFFMHNLGAYKVDRKKTALLYKDVLKEYCTVSIELGYHNLFFPGGTRSRSGAVEPRLKLGLLGCGLRAYVNNLKRKVARPRVFIVPCTLSYGLTLEAETLIDDYLKETGKARYVIEDDESSRLVRVASFLAGIVSLDARIYLTISQPLDPFGNHVGPDGESHDRRGRRIEIDRYVLVRGAPEHDAQRDAEYTRELGSEVLEAFRRDNTLQATHLCAFALFEMLRRRNPSMDLYRLLRTGGREDTVPIGDLLRTLGRIASAAKERSAKCELRLDPRLRELDEEGIVAEALKAFGSYHPRAPVLRRGDRISSGDPNLLFYYHNRATGYGFEASIDEGAPAPPPIDLARRPASGELWPPRAPRPAPELARRPTPELVGAAAGADLGG